MGEEQLLPLFPLPVVLFPGATIPLHIFEDRYRLMVGQAAREHSEFGILLAHEGELDSIGCTAAVQKITREYDDGRFDVRVEGRRRYQVLSLDQSKPYLQARVEFFDDEDSAAPVAEQVRLVERLSREIAAMLRTSLPDFAASMRTSFVVAHQLPLDPAFKQQLLVKRSENQRLEALAAHLKELTNRLDTIRRTQKVARTNGQTGRH